MPPLRARRSLVSLVTLALGGIGGISSISGISGCTMLAEVFDPATPATPTPAQSAMVESMLGSPTATATGSTPANAVAQAGEKSGGEKSGGEKSGVARAAGTASEDRSAPPAFDAAAFVGVGSAAAAPAGFDKYPKTMHREDALALGADPLEGDDGRPSLYTLHPTREAYDRVHIHFGKGETPLTVNIRFNPTRDARAQLLELRDAMAKRYGRGEPRPEGATYDDAERYRWRAPKMSIGVENGETEQVIAEVWYR